MSDVATTISILTFLPSLPTALSPLPSSSHPHHPLPLQLKWHSQHKATGDGRVCDTQMRETGVNGRREKDTRLTTCLTTYRFNHCTTYVCFCGHLMHLLVTVPFPTSNTSQTNQAHYSASVSRTMHNEGEEAVTTLAAEWSAWHDSAYAKHKRLEHHLLIVCS